MKQGNLKYFEFIDTIGGSPYPVAQYNLEEVTANVTSAGEFSNPKIEDYGNGWYRCSAEATATQAVHFNMSKGSSTGSSVVGTDEYLYIWGAQIEEQSYATSYIPTNGATNTRLQDIANNSGNSSLINSTEGVLFLEIAALADDSTDRRITISDGTNNNRVGFGYN